MPILSSIAGAAAKAYGMMANAKRIITDTFNRSDGSLGTSSSGHLWSVLRGTWAISSSKATSSTAGSSYPLASVDVEAKNVIVSADITDGGPGVAFWVTDANSWWASSVNYRTSSGCTGSGGNASSGGGDCGSYTNPTYAPTTCTGAGGNSSSGGGNCGTLVAATYAPTTCTGPGGNSTSGGGNCGTLIPAATTTTCGTKVGVGDCNFENGYYLFSTVQTCPPGKTYVPDRGDCCELVLVGGSIIPVNCGGLTNPCAGQGGPGVGNCGIFISGGFTGSNVTTTTQAYYTGSLEGGQQLTQAYYTGSLQGGQQLTQGYYSGSTQTTYYTDLKIYSSVSGTITTAATSTLNSNVSGYSEANSIKVTTNGESISAQAFSSAGLSSQLGSTLTYTASGANRGTKTGIIKTPSDANPGSLLDNFATENVL
jgi:hypothetical protein